MLNVQQKKTRVESAYTQHHNSCMLGPVCLRSCHPGQAFPSLYRPYGTTETASAKLRRPSGCILYMIYNTGTQERKDWWCVCVGVDRRQQQRLHRPAGAEQGVASGRHPHSRLWAARPCRGRRPSQRRQDRPRWVQGRMCLQLYIAAMQFVVTFSCHHLCVLYVQ